MIASLSFLSQVNQYTWNFWINSNPTKISVLALSVEEARQEVLAKLCKISNLAPEYNRLWEQLPLHQYKSPEDLALKKQLDELHQQVDIDVNIGNFCADLFKYTPTCLVETTSEEMTLEKLISETSPTVSKIKTVSVFSCLDG